MKKYVSKRGVHINNEDENKNKKKTEPRNWEKYEYEKCKINYKHITHMPYILCWSDMKLDFYVKEFFFGGEIGRKLHPFS